MYFISHFSQNIDIVQEAAESEIPNQMWENFNNYDLR